MSKIIVNVKKENPNERDFKENPLEINTETIGILQKERDVKQNAKETHFEGEGFESTDVEGALKEVFTHSDNNRKKIIDVIGNPLNQESTYQEILGVTSDSKADILNALSYKGVSVVPGVSFGGFAEAILKISGSATNGESSDLLRLTDIIEVKAANTSYELKIKPYLKPSQTVAQIYRFIDQNPSIVNYKDDFNNANAKSFDFDVEELDFDGMMHIKDSYSYQFSRVADYFETSEIDFSAFLEFGGSVVLTENDATIKGIKTTQSVARANRDIPLDETLEINSVKLTSVGTVRVVMSRNSGFTWQVFDGLNFNDINISDLGAFRNLGMTAETLNSITKAQWAQYRDGSNVIRFAYFIERATYSVSSGTDVVTMDSNMAARWIPAATTDYTYEFDTSAQAYNIVFLKAGSYKIRYLDGEK